MPAVGTFREGIGGNWRELEGQKYDLWDKTAIFTAIIDKKVIPFVIPKKGPRKNRGPSKKEGVMRCPTLSGLCKEKTVPCLRTANAINNQSMSLLEFLQGCLSCHAEYSIDLNLMAVAVRVTS